MALDFLEVVPAESECKWYVKCIEDCKLTSLAPSDVYMELLYFIAINWKILGTIDVRSIPLSRYITAERKWMFGDVRYVKQVENVCYALDSQQHAWINKWNIEFGCPGNLYFLSVSNQMALVSHVSRRHLFAWLSGDAGVVSATVYEYIYLVQEFARETGDPKLLKSLTHFLYHSHLKNFVTESEVYSVRESMPIIAGHDQICDERTETLVPASGSKWVKLMGCNPFVEKKYIDLGEAYTESGTFAGEHTPKEDLIKFLTKYMKAKDLLELCPPYLALPVASSQLRVDQAFLLLEWIRTLQFNKVEMPAMFIERIRVGKWMKTCSGFNSPNHCFLFHDEGEYVFLQMGNVLWGFSVIDEQFYGTKIRLYADELKLIGVRFESMDVCRLIIDHVTSLASSRITSEHGILLLEFIRYLKKGEKLYDEFLRTLRKGEWMKSSKGYVAPFGSVFLPSITGALLQITNLPVIDETFYGTTFGCYTAELKLLGVVMDMEEVYKLTADNFTFPEALSTVTRESVLLILRCLRNLGPLAAGLIEKISCEPWLKTSLGFKSPSSSFLPNSEYGLLLNVVEVPLIDESFYGNEICSFIAELKAIGVVLDFESSIKKVVIQFKLVSSSGGLTSANVLSLLTCTKNMKETVPSLLSTFRSFLFGESWLKTRHGFKSPPESVLFDVKWGTISQYVDLEN
ncbi:uncharacterized protein LOC131238803 [Magnolia sinica]|uniref:uncharacterized protein LOC131238803 n=1 Tax=Magnolia sinica TaxID=86752 RepID=UPI002657D192|nr:uncharacterized protein LOC131238803 [Magnolia sinica]